MSAVTLPATALECAIINVDSKKQVLEKIAHIAFTLDESINCKEVMEALQRREKLGSTAIGFGVAIPHARIPTLQQPLCIALRLTHPINFSETEQQKVSMVFSLLVPEEANDTHLALLAEISQRCRNALFRQRFLSAKDQSTLFNLIYGDE